MENYQHWKPAYFKTPPELPTLTHLYGHMLTRIVDTQSTHIELNHCSHCKKKLEVDLTSSKLQSGFIWVQAVARLLLAWLRVTPLSQSSIVAKDELGN